MTVNVSKPVVNVREKLAELDKPTGVAGEAMLRAETPQEQFNLIGAGRRNLMINGDFQVNQRGTSVAASASAYFYGAADRWSSYAYSGASSATIAVVDSREIMPDGSAITRYASVTSTSNRILFSQRVENSGQFSGQTLTLSGWVKAPSGNATAGTDLEYGITITYGTGGDSIEPVITDGTKTETVITTEWQKFSITFSVPDKSSKTFGPNNTSELFVFLTSDGVAGTLHFANVQLEVGKVATPFEHRSYGEELALCQRYYYRLTGDGGSDTIGTAAIYSATQAVTNVYFPVTMRTTPTLSVASGTNAFRLWIAGSSYNNDGDDVGNQDASEHAAMIFWNGFTGLTAGQAGWIRMSSGGSVAYDAEL